MEDAKFYIKRYANGTIGRRSMCIECGNKARYEWLSSNKKKDNDRNKAYNKTNATRIRGEKLRKKYWSEATWQEALLKHQALLDFQNGGCAICHQPGHPTRGLHVDHCHKTSKVRGLLCYNCNNGIGRLKDSVQILQAATEYLKKVS